MRDANNIRALEILDIDWIGFIFYAPSPRNVPDDDEICHAIRSCAKIKVGVFVNEEYKKILSTVEKYQLNHVQLHGDETPDFCRQLCDAGCRVIKVFSVSSEADLTKTAAYEPFVEYLLFDTKSSERGGTGKRFEWSLLEAYQGITPFLLSGGIAPEHITDLSKISHLRMTGIDLNSRFELSPGLKNIVKIENFLSLFKKKYH